MKAEQTEAPAAKTLTNNGAWGAPEGGEPSPRWHTWPREEDRQESPTATEFCFVPFLFFLPLLPSFPCSLPPLLSPSLPPLFQIWAPTLLSLSHTWPCLRREMMPSDRTPSPLEGRRVLCACGQWTCVHLSQDALSTFVASQGGLQVTVRHRCSEGRLAGVGGRQAVALT